MQLSRLFAVSVRLNCSRSLGAEAGVVVRGFLFQLGVLMQIRFDEAEGRWYVGKLQFSSEEAAQLYLDARRVQEAPSKPHPVPAWVYIVGSVLTFSMLFLWVWSFTNDKAGPTAVVSPSALSNVSKQTLEGVAFLINANGKLCAEVLEVRRRDDGRFAVVCRESRAQALQKGYTVDLKNGSVE